MCQLLGICSGKTNADVKHSCTAIRFLLKWVLNTGEKKKREVIFKHKGYGTKEEKARQLKKKVGTCIVHDVMEEKILWNNSMSKGSSVSPTSSYLDFVSVCYSSIVNYNNCIS